MAKFCQIWSRWFLHKYFIGFTGEKRFIEFSPPNIFQIKPQFLRVIMIFLTTSTTADQIAEMIKQCPMMDYIQDSIKLRWKTLLEYLTYLETKFDKMHRTCWGTFLIKRWIENNFIQFKKGQNPVSFYFRPYLTTMTNISINFGCIKAWMVCLGFKSGTTGW